MPESLESRRRAVAEALRRDAADARMVALTQRMNVVEAVVFDSTWDSAPLAAMPDEATVATTPAVPAVPLSAPAMSPRAADVLFGRG
jgi:hypothetical protein